MLTVNCIEKMKIKEKNGHLKKIKHSNKQKKNIRLITFLIIIGQKHLAEFEGAAVASSAQIIGDVID